MAEPAKKLFQRLGAALEFGDLLALCYRRLSEGENFGFDFLAGDPRDLAFKGRRDIRHFAIVHGGRLEASSPGLGQGSTFRFVVPRGEVLEPAPGTAESRSNAPATSQAPVVVADDNVDAAESLAAVLELDGYSVHIARDGVEALELATRLKPMACFLDIGMPRMNGFEVAKELHRVNGGAVPFLVATTGWGQAEDKRRALEAGFDVHLTKPIDLNEASKLLAQRKVQ